MSGECLVFNSKREGNFLRGLPTEVRGLVLAREVKTAAYEAEFLPTYTREYKLVNGRVFEAESRLFVADLAARGGRPEEVRAMRVIEDGLRLGKAVVNFSPKNEAYSYPQSCVDFWRVDGGEVRWMRLVVKNNFYGLRSVWENLGGEGEVKNEFDLLAKPIMSEKKIGEVLQMLDLAEKTSKHSKEEIDRVVERMSAIFYSQFGPEKMMEQEIIFRFWSAVIAELDRIENRRLDFSEGVLLRNYLYGEMRQVIRSSGGCSGMNMVGEFTKGQGFYVINATDGLKVSKGVVPEGYKYCQKCGVWYSGERCPFCG